LTRTLTRSTATLTFPLSSTSTWSRRCTIRRTQPDRRTADTLAMLSYRGVDLLTSIVAMSTKLIQL
jgi:hypothetical protein